MKADYVHKELSEDGYTPETLRLKKSNFGNQNVAIIANSLFHSFVLIVYFENSSNLFGGEFFKIRRM